MRKNRQLICRYAALAILWLYAICLHSSAYSQPTAISLPAGVVEGTLPNGFHYIILPNSKPAAKVEFRLIMRVGSLLETEQEKGCSHFLEHIAFGGTAHFPQRSMVESLEKLGMKYGQDINAFTGFDRTVYMFAAPVDRNKDAVLENALLIVRDWMDGMAIEPAKVENEKGIILEELRGYDVGDDFYQLKIGTGLFKNRMPLGDAEDIERMTPQMLADYYHKWYVPSLATLVVAGDVASDEVEQKIKRMFASLKASPSPAEIPVCPLEYNKGISLCEIQDSLLSHTKIELIIPYPCIVEKTIDDAVQKQQRLLLVKALSSRLNARRLQCSLSDRWYLSDKNHFVLALEGSSREELLAQITKIISELNCLARNGWAPQEWQDIREEFCNNYAAQEISISKNSSEWCDDFIDYVISGDRYITDNSQKKEVLDKLRSTPVEKMQQLLKELFAYRQNTLLVACRSHSRFGLTKEEIESAWQQGEETACMPYTYARKATAETSLRTPECLAIRHAFNPEYIKEIKDYPLTGIREVILSNGIRLVLKTTPQAEPNLLLTSFAPLGLSSIPAGDYPLLEGTASYIDMGGIAKAADLTDFLYQQEMALTTVIENHWHGFIGSSPSANAPQFFNLIYEKTLHPELNYTDFEESRQEMLASSSKETTLEKLLKRDSERLIAARISELMGESLPQAHHKLTAKELQQLNLDTIAAFYNSLYSRPEGTTYIVCGNFDADTLTRQFAAVFGRMPALSTPTQWNYPDFHLPENTIEENFPASKATKTSFDCILFGHYSPGLKNTLILKLMCNIIHNRLISILREQKSLVYSPYVSLKYDGIPWGTFYFNINTSADSSSMSEVKAVLFSLLYNLQEETISEEELQNIKRSFLIAKRETLNQESASAWRTTLAGLLKNGETIADFEEYEQLLAGITPALLRDAFQKQLNLRKYLFFTAGPTTPAHL